MSRPEVVKIGFGFPLNEQFPHLDAAKLVREFIRAEKENRSNPRSTSATGFTTDSSGNDWLITALLRAAPITVKRKRHNARVIQGVMRRLDEKGRPTDDVKRLKIQYREVAARFENDSPTLPISEV